MTDLFRRTNKYLLPIFRRSWIILTVTLVGCELGHQYFTHIAHDLAQNSSVAQVPAMLGDLLVGLLEYTVLTMLIPQRILELDKNEAPGSFWAFTERHVWPLTVESIRQLAVSILWLFALIVPGVIKYIRYTFVSYIVVANPEYAAGNVDALAESERLIKGITLPLFVLTMGSTALDYWQGSLRESHSLYSAPIVALAMMLIFFIANYYINVLLFVLYQMRREKAGMGDK